MKTILLVGKTLEYAFYVAASAYLFRIICSVIIGYAFMTPEYAGPSYYYWRKAYCDTEASKATYSYIAKNSENDYDVFKTYIGNVQSGLSPSELKEATKEIEASIADDESMLESLKASGDQSAIQQLREKIEASNERLRALPLTTDGFEPLYSDAKFTDSFILGPKKTYKIFLNRGDSKDISKLEPELDFLNFRQTFIKYMKAKGSGSKYSVIDENAVEKFFNNGDPSILRFDDMPGDLTRVSFNDPEVTESFIISTSRVEAIKNLIRIHKPFSNVVNAMETNRDPIVTFVDGRVEIDGDALENMVEIAKLSGLSAFFDGDDAIKTEIRGFFDRIAKIKPTAFDSHILNRIYYYFFFMNSSLAPQDVLERDEAYKIAYQKSKDAKTEAENISNPDARRDLDNKAKVFEKKYTERRTQLIFNHFSQLVAENLGDKGHLLDKSKDSRLPFFKWFAYPAVYSSSDEKKHRSVFNDEDIASA